MSDLRLDGFYDVVDGRRDVRRGFTLDPVDDAALTRVLAAAHAAGSVGHSQPWDFLVLRDEAVRHRVQRLAAAQRDRFAATLPAARARQLAGIATEAILRTPLSVVVTCDPTRGGRHVLGRHSQPQMAPYSTALAVQNLWLAARAEGLGVGWVSFFDERELAALLGLPEHVEVVAFLCVGHVTEFAAEPELATAGWSRRRPLAWAVHDGQLGAARAARGGTDGPARRDRRGDPPGRSGGAGGRPRAPDPADQAARRARRCSRTCRCGWPASPGAARRRFRSPPRSRSSRPTTACTPRASRRGRRR